MAFRFCRNDIEYVSNPVHPDFGTDELAATIEMTTEKGCNADDKKQTLSDGDKVNTGKSSGRRVILPIVCHPNNPNLSIPRLCHEESEPDTAC